MPKPNQIDAIREYSRQGLSANEIQRRLSKQRMGLRRAVLLNYVRGFKGQKSKAKVSKYVPHKYRIPLFVGAKQVAEYGKVHGQSRRIQVYGSGKQLYKLMQLISQHPPRERFLIIDANSLLSHPWRYLSMEFWDERPEIKS